MPCVIFLIFELYISYQAFVKSLLLIWVCLLQDYSMRVLCVVPFHSDPAALHIFRTISEPN